MVGAILLGAGWVSGWLNITLSDGRRPTQGYIKFENWWQKCEIIDTCSYSIIMLLSMLMKIYQDSAPSPRDCTLGSLHDKFCLSKSRIFVRTILTSILWDKWFYPTWARAGSHMMQGLWPCNPLHAKHVQFTAPQPTVISSPYATGRTIYFRDIA